ncbi:Uncharacterized protein BM_BM6402 [Brugia malayi]|uniref:Bm6402, isoform d n=1 Tax=Brugia malayi TaxID=6279 RepID=A0A1P6C7T3_BRUMA|nr:Uncharacterized protein BM_BM6402 [Brugia malayi]CDP94999.1 Bm6402, isoform d [Brugia malayi]VIO87122.1 Uncharacterized protein BM_BM6402 [Brugia malayi]
MHTDDESEIEYTVVKRVASVTIESDSQVEAEVQQRSGRIRRKKRIVKRKNVNDKMDVDIIASQFSIINRGMDWDGLCSASELSSSETCSSDGREADDEQSDWVGRINEDQNFPLPQISTKQQRFIKTRTASAALQRKLERFIRDDSQRELVVKNWTGYQQVSRVLQFFGLEVLKRGRGMDFQRKLPQSCCEEYYMPEETNLTGQRRLTFKVEFGIPVRGAFTGQDFEVLVNEAVRLVLGQSAPNYSLGLFNEIERKGSVVVQASDVNLIWAALSVYGRFFGKPIALHFNSLTEVRVL